MELFAQVTIMVSGVMWICMAMLASTHNLRSAVVFKVFPMLTGIANIIIALHLLGYLK